MQKLCFSSQGCPFSGQIHRLNWTRSPPRRSACIFSFCLYLRFHLDNGSHLGAATAQARLEAHWSSHTHVTYTPRHCHHHPLQPTRWTGRGVSTAHAKYTHGPQPQEHTCAYPCSMCRLHRTARTWRTSRMQRLSPSSRPASHPSTRCWPYRRRCALRTRSHAVARKIVLCG